MSKETNTMEQSLESKSDDNDQKLEETLVSGPNQDHETSMDSEADSADRDPQDQPSELKRDDAQILSVSSWINLSESEYCPERSAPSPTQSFRILTPENLTQFNKLDFQGGESVPVKTVLMAKYINDQKRLRESHGTGSEGKRNLRDESCPFLCRTDSGKSSGSSFALVELTTESALSRTGVAPSIHLNSSPGSGCNEGAEEYDCLSVSVATGEDASSSSEDAIHDIRCLFLDQDTSNRASRSVRSCSPATSSKPKECKRDPNSPAIEEGDEEDDWYHQACLWAKDTLSWASDQFDQFLDALEEDLPPPCTCYWATWSLVLGGGVVVGLVTGRNLVNRMV